MSASSTKRVVFINQATGYLTIDIVNAFACSNNFDRVALIAGSIRVQDIALSDKVEYSRISLYDRGNPKRKLLSWLKGTLQIFWMLVTKYRRFEVFYITIPPFAYLLSLVLPHRFSVLVFDVYPDVLEIYNIRRSNVIYRAWGRCNRYLFRCAHRIYTIGEGMEKLLSNYVLPSKVTVIPNWTGLTKVREVAKEENFFIEQQGLKGKFIVQYSGNIGYTHNVELLLDIARAMRNDNDVFFLIIGRGEKFNVIRDLVKQEGLANCRLLPFQPDDILNFTLAAADLGVVLLDDRTAHVSIPSKIYNLQAVGVPILAIADISSQLALHVQKHQNGRCFGPSDKAAIVAFIRQVKNDKLLQQQLRANSKLAGQQYTCRNAQLYLEAYLDKDLATDD